MTLKRNLELVCLIKDVSEVVIVELRTQKGVSVHCIENETVQIKRHKVAAQYALPEVSG